MDRFSIHRFLVVVVLPWFVILSCEEKQTHIIVENGLPRAIIAVSQTASEAVEFAAQELQTYLKKVSGAKLPIVSDIDSLLQSIISVGNTKFTQDDGVDASMLEPEGFLIRTHGKNLAVVGKDDDGTQFAVYDFLDKYLDIRWYWPGEFGEVVPKKRTITLGKINVREEPDFIYRNRAPDVHPRFSVSPEHLAALELWEKRNRWGGSIQIDGSHEFGRMLPPSKYAYDHPEYYALVDGKRDCDPATFNGTHGCQLCTTNPEVVKISVEYVRRYFDEHPETDVLNISPNDGGGFCEGERCQALDSGRLSPEKLATIPIEEINRHPEKQTVITDRIFTFVNQVAEEVQLTHPERSVLCYVYSRYREPPENIQIHPYVIPQYTSWSAYLHANEEFRRQNEKRIEEWIDAGGNISIYEYLENNSWPGLSRLVVPQFADFIRFLHQRGVRLFHTQSGNGFGINGINYYVVARLLWDTEQDEDEILDEFYSNIFREAAPAMKRFHKRQIEAWSKVTGDPNNPPFRPDGDIQCRRFSSTRILEYLTGEFISNCRSDLTHAMSIAKDELTKERVEFFSKGFRYTELTADAIRKAKELEARGVPMFPWVEDPVNLLEKADSDLKKMALSKRLAIWKERLGEQDPVEVEKLVDEALLAWEARDRYVEGLKDDFVLSYIRIQKNNIGREFNPRKNLEYMQQIIQKGRITDTFLEERPFYY